jgi:hypothetical protein
VLSRFLFAACLRLRACGVAAALLIDLEAIAVLTIGLEKGFNDLRTSSFFDLFTDRVKNGLSVYRYVWIYFGNRKPKIF